MPITLLTSESYFGTVHEDLAQDENSYLPSTHAMLCKDQLATCHVVKNERTPLVVMLYLVFGIS